MQEVGRIDVLVSNRMLNSLELDGAWVQDEINIHDQKSKN
jgi:hypothetical protein